MRVSEKGAERIPVVSASARSTPFGCYQVYLMDGHLETSSNVNTFADAMASEHLSSDNDLPTEDQSQRQSYPAFN